MTAARETDDKLPAKEEALWRDLKLNKSALARETLFSAYSAFAANLARRHKLLSHGSDIEFGDLQQLAFIGLLEVIDLFDPFIGVPFKSYARHRILGSMHDGLAHLNEFREQLSWRRRVRRERIASLHSKRRGGSSLSDAMAELVEVAVGLALGFMLEDIGITVNEASSSPSLISGTAYDGYAWRETVAHLEMELKELSPREQMILHQHYVIGVGFDQLGSALGVTKGRISQMHRMTLERLRKRMTDRGHFQFER